MEDEIFTINKKIANLEDEIKKIHTTLHEYGKADVRLEETLKSLELQLISIKQDVVATVQDNSQKTWELIHKGIKIIIALVAIICLMAGVKLLPEFFNILGGI